MRGTRQKLKALYLKEILEEETDENHSINMEGILTALEINGIPAERRSIYDDIRLLTDEYGLPIAHEENGRTYRLEEHMFHFSELKLIIDAVSSCKTLTERRSQELINKLKRLCSKHERATLWGQVIVSDRAKTQNQEVHANIEMLNLALAQQRLVKFQYYYYGIDKKKVYSFGGQYYKMTPVSLVYADNNYYLLCLDKHNQRRHFRVDRMTNVALMKMHFDRNRVSAKVELEHYTKYTFSMYGGGDVIPVTMRFDKKLVSMVLDRFGQDTVLMKDGDNHFTITHSIAVSPQFYAWLFALGDKAEIVSPVSVREEMADMLKNLYTHYSDK